jgi:RHS repeat-associated protein
MVGLAFFIIASLIQAVNQFGKVELTRNILGQILSDTQNGNAVNSEYDFLGNRNRVTSSMGANLNLSRDKMGDITQMSQEDWTVDFVRNQVGLETERNMGNLKSSFQRDKMGRITEHRVSVGGDAKRTKSYKWGYNDRLHEILDNKLGLTTFEHDIFGNLASANYGSGIKQLRNPDEVGNLFKTEGRTDRKYDKGGRLLEADGTNYEYDLEGNLSKKTLKDGSIWTYEWNASGMLAKVIRPDGEAVSFEYDALGRRTKKIFKGISTAWVWDGNTPLHEWTDEAEVTTWLFEENSFAPIGKLKAEAKYNIVSDYLGTPFEMYDQSGGRVWQGELDSFGAIQNFKGDSKTDCPFRYQGQYEDAETGLYYNRFRYYSPEEGVYLSQDPIRLRGGTQMYGYVHDTNEMIDPSGLSGIPGFDALKKMAESTLDFSTSKGGAVFWSGGNMGAAQAWAKATGRTTLEQTAGGKFLNGLNLFDNLPANQAAEVWDIASKRFADGASGNIHVFSTKASKISKYTGGLKTWWRIEKPALLSNAAVTNVFRMKVDGTMAQFGHILKKIC